MGDEGKRQVGRSYLDQLFLCLFIHFPGEHDLLYIPQHHVQMLVVGLGKSGSKSTSMQASINSR